MMVIDHMLLSYLSWICDHGRHLIMIQIWPAGENGIFVMVFLGDMALVQPDAILVIMVHNHQYSLYQKDWVKFGAVPL